MCIVGLSNEDTENSDKIRAAGERKSVLSLLRECNAR